MWRSRWKRWGQGSTTWKPWKSHVWQGTLQETCVFVHSCVFHNKATRLDGHRKYRSFERGLRDAAVGQYVETGTAALERWARRRRSVCGSTYHLLRLLSWHLFPCDITATRDLLNLSATSVTLMWHQGMNDLLHRGEQDSAAVSRTQKAFCMKDETSIYLYITLVILSAI